MSFAIIIKRANSREFCVAITTEGKATTWVKEWEESENGHHWYENFISKEPGDTASIQPYYQGAQFC
jgi:hypothetical protein